MAYEGVEAEVTVCEAGQAASSPSHYCWVTPLPGPAREWRLRTASKWPFLDPTGILRAPLLGQSIKGPFMVCFQAGKTG